MHNEQVLQSIYIDLTFFALKHLIFEYICSVQANVSNGHNTNGCVKKSDGDNVPKKNEDHEEYQYLNTIKHIIEKGIFCLIKK